MQPTALGLCWSEILTERRRQRGFWRGGWESGRGWFGDEIAAVSDLQRGTPLQSHVLNTFDMCLVGEKPKSQAIRKRF